MHARCHFRKAFQLEHEIFLHYIFLCCDGVLQFFFSFGEMCGPSTENPNVVRLLDLKNCARDVKAHLKFCNILTNVESVNSERKLLLARAGK